ncbi:MAG: chromosome partitioning protein ParA [Lachnospiraceae bacterium]|nr:chromosome partitioning protein ParA [Lachnospiraceae bacterium]
MKIKLALLEKDSRYLNRMVAAFNTKYADKFEIYSFTEPEAALSALESARINVFVAGNAFEIDTNLLPKRCGFAYFVDSADVDMVNGQRAICKFQKADLIYKQILSIYSENAGSVSGLKFADDSCRIIAFTSPSGGTGSSSMAAACALHYAAQGKKTLYLNLETFGSSDLFFSAEGQFDMSDIIFALKSKKVNLAMKLESCVKQDPRGVYFYSQAKIALDMTELGAEEIQRLVSEARLSGAYDYMILDLDFGLEQNSAEILKKAHSIVWVGDGSEISNTKLSRAYSAVATLEQNKDIPLNGRICLAYNKFSNKTGKTISDSEIRSIGGAPKYEHAETAQVLERLSALELFDKIG